MGTMHLSIGPTAKNDAVFREDHYFRAPCASTLLACYYHCSGGTPPASSFYQFDAFNTGRTLAQLTGTAASGLWQLGLMSIVNSDLAEGEQIFFRGKETAGNPNPSIGQTVVIDDGRVDDNMIFSYAPSWSIGVSASTEAQFTKAEAAVTVLDARFCLRTALSVGSAANKWQIQLYNSTQATVLAEWNTDTAVDGAVAANVMHSFRLVNPSTIAAGDILGIKLVKTGTPAQASTSIPQTWMFAG